MGGSLWRDESRRLLWELPKLVQLGRLEMDLDDPDVVRALSKVHTWPLTLDVCRAIHGWPIPEDEVRRRGTEHACQQWAGLRKALGGP